MSFTAVLPFLKIFIIFATMIVGIRLKIGLGNAIMAGAVVLGLVFVMNPVQWVTAAFTGAVSESAILLGAIVGLILLLSDLLEKTGQSQALMDCLTGYLKHPRLRLFFFPALIGFLPMPGGAVFSAPMVKSASARMNIGDEDKVLINYWFRHIWEPCWPLYPGLLLTASLAGLPIMKLAAMGIPSTLFWFSLGWFFYLRPGVLPITETALPEGEQNANNGPGRLRRTVFLGMPLIVAIVGSISLEAVVASTLPNVPYELGVIMALALAVLCVIAQNSGAAKIAWQCVTRPHLYKMLYLIVAIFAFKETLQSAGAIEELAQAAGGSAALFTAALVLPFLTGMVGGITIGFAGSSFPLLFGLLHQLGMDDQLVPYTMLGLFAGYAGVMISPLHVCFILTCEYFKKGMGAPLKRLAVPCAALMLWGVAYWKVLQ